MVDGLLRIDLAEEAAAVDLPQVVVGLGFAGGGLEQVPLGLARVLRRPLAVVVEAPEEQFGAWLGGVLGVLQVAEHLFQVALVGIVVEQLGQADPGRG